MHPLDKALVIVIVTAILSVASCTGFVEHARYKFANCHKQQVE